MLCNVDAKLVRNVYDVWQEGDVIHTTIQRNTALGNDVVMDVYYQVNDLGVRRDFILQ